MAPAHLDDAARRALGAWYTPPRLVEHVCDVATEEMVARQVVRVIDPACGDGRILEACGARVRARGAVPELVGLDVDPQALDVARARLGPRALLRRADALVEPWGGPFDVVVGNPPFLGQLARRTRRRAPAGVAAGPYADTAALFLALAVRNTSPGGRVALVLPQSVLATRDTAPVRAEVLAHAALVTLWWAGEAVFPDASVLTCICSFTVGAEQSPVRRWRGPSFEPLAPAGAADLRERSTWSHLVADVAGVPPVSVASSGRLGDVATAAADFRDQYYGLVPFVSDDVAGPPLVTAGLIDPGGCAWGQRPARFARRTFAAPRVDLARLEAESDLGPWARSRLVPKVLLASQTRVLEAAVDEAGAWLPSVPVVSVVPRAEGDLWRVATALLSPVASAWAASTYLGAGLSAGAIKVSAAQVLDLPLPAGPLEEAADRLRCGDLDGAGVASCRAYSVDDPALLAWWRAGVARALRAGRRPAPPS